MQKEGRYIGVEDNGNVVGIRQEKILSGEESQREYLKCPVSC